MISSRRHFVGALGAGALLPALPGNAHAATPLPSPVAADVDMSWVDRVTGQFRAVFDVPEVEEGVGIFRAGMWSGQVRSVYGEATTCSTVLVIRHNAIDLAMHDAHWARFPVAKEAKWKNPRTKKWFVVNPMRAVPEGTSPARAMMTMEGFIAGGGIVLACDLAFRFAVARYRDGGKVPAADARAAAMANLIPGVILQPSGFFAAIRAQDAGCRFMPGV